MAGLRRPQRPSKRARGRPALSDDQRKSEAVGVHLTKAIKAKLDEARKRPDGEISISEEIERRVRQSFELDQRIRDRFGGAGTFSLLRIVVEGITSIERRTKHRWFEDLYTFDQVKLMFNTVYEHFRPAHGASQELIEDQKNFGRRVALYLLSMLEAARDFPRWSSAEAMVPNIFHDAAFPLGLKLKGSPTEELFGKSDQKSGDER
jgi:hypothetical protein